MSKEISKKKLFFAPKVTDWYDQHKRDLPWRHTTDPYHIWLSEVILQQTRVAQGLPYFERFLESYPTVGALAAADLQDVLRLWQGLGYYSRARNMHATARQVAQEWNGEFPKTYDELIKLKGIGPYTAAAIASFASNEAVPVVDGNVYRVLARVFGVKDDIAGGKAYQTFRTLAAELMPDAHAAKFNQAIMEFGALQCTPHRPNCMFCPLQAECFAFNHQQQETLPVKSPKAKPKDRHLTYVVIRTAAGYLLAERSDKDIWTGLFDFYLIETPVAAETPDEFADDYLAKLLESGHELSFIGTKKHLLTHQRLYANFWLLDATAGDSPPLPEGYQTYSVDEIHALPKSRLTLDILTLLKI